MKVEQISIFLENKAGRLAEVTPNPCFTRGIQYIVFPNILNLLSASSCPQQVPPPHLGGLRLPRGNIARLILHPLQFPHDRFLKCQQ